jgi:hypothetical protein
MTGRVPCLAAAGKSPYGLRKEAECDAQSMESRLASAFRGLLKNSVDSWTPLLGFFGSSFFLGGHVLVSLVWLIKGCERFRISKSVRGVLAELTKPCHRKNCKKIVNGHPPQTEPQPRSARRGRANRASGACIVRTTLATTDVLCVPILAVKE